MKPTHERTAILLGAQRCGTHLLGSCIGSHPQVTYVDEITVGISLSELKNKLKTKRDINKHIDEFYSGIATDWILLDVKYRHIFGPLEKWIREHKIIHIKRTDIDAVFYSMIHAEIRRSKQTGEYARWIESWEDKKKAKSPEGNAPIIDYSNNRTEDLEKWLKRNWKHFEDVGLEFEYNELTSNKQIDKLPSWASKEVCAFLGIEYHMLTTSLQKMSPANFRRYLK